MDFTFLQLVICFQGLFWVPLLILLWLLLHEGPVSPRGPLAFPPFLRPLAHRDTQGHHFPSRQRGVLRGDRQ